METITTILGATAAATAVATAAWKAGAWLRKWAATKRKRRRQQHQQQALRQALTVAAEQAGAKRPSVIWKLVELPPEGLPDDLRVLNPAWMVARVRREYPELFHPLPPPRTPEERDRYLLDLEQDLWPDEP